MKSLCLLIALPLWTAACHSIGPGTIPRDRFDYGEAISDSWKEQMLLSIVKLRYVDMPMFVEVSSVINQYALEGDVSLSRTWDGAQLWSAGASARFADRPTITYSPILGKEFTRNLMTPVPPGALLFLVQSGWPVELMFRVCVQAVNGIYNRGGASSTGRDEPDPRFNEVIRVLERIQRRGAIGLRLGGFEQDEAAFVVIRKHLDEEVLRDSAAVRAELGLEPDSDEFRAFYGADSPDGKSIAMLTRSLFEILIELGRHVDVPPEHLERTAPGLAATNPSARLIHIHHSAEKPEGAFVAVHYRDLWFWIDDSDLGSKRTFAFVMILFNLTSAGSTSAVPLLTVGAG